MKNPFILLILLVSTFTCIAQSEMSKRFDINPGEQIILEFDEANIVKVSGWQEDHISIEAKVVINENTQNDAYEIVSTNEQKKEIIRGFIKDKENIPQVIRIKKGDEIFTFHTDNWDSPEIQEFYAQNGTDDIQWKSHGISWEIEVSIKIPKSQDILINSKHGIIELENLSGKVEANSKHGGIDLTVENDLKTQVDLKTKWGTIYSNVNLKVDKELSSDHDWNHVIASINGGKNSSYFLTSKHANIYLRHK